MTRPREHGIWLTAILVLACVLRFFLLGANSYWHDEVHTLIKAENIWDLLSTGEYISNHPPLFALLVAAWNAVGLGANEWSMRLLPALLGVGVVYTVYVAGRTLFDVRTALFAAFLAAISPFFIAQSQDLKDYIVLPITGTLAVCALYMATTHNTRPWWVAYSLSAALACYSESFAGPLLVAANLWFVLDLKGRRNRLPAWAIANAAAFVAFLPYLVVLVGRARVMLVDSENWWIPEPTILSVVFLVKTFSFGYSSWEIPYKVALAVYGAAAFIGAAIALATRARVALLVLIWLAVPIAIVFAISHVVESIFLYRALIPFAVPFYLLVAIPCVRLRARFMPGVCVAVFALLAAPSLWQHYNRIFHEMDFPHRPGTHPPQDYRGVSEFVLANWHEGDAVITASAGPWLPMYWYGLRGHPLLCAAVDDTFIQDVRSGNPRTTDSKDFEFILPNQVEALTEGYGRIWFVYSDWERKYLPGNAMSVWRWLDAHCAELQAESFLGMELRLYDRVGSHRKAVRRDDDDGISANVYLSNGGKPHRVIVPDSGLIAKPYEARRGLLRLRFVDAIAAERHNVAQTDKTRMMSFAIENVARQPVEAWVEVRVSDAMIVAASLMKANPTADPWRANTHYNVHENPRTYELSVASAYFREAGDATLIDTITLLPGVYESLVYALGSPEDTVYNRAEFDIQIGNVVLTSRTVRRRRDRYRWAWTQGAMVSATGRPLEVRLTARHLLGGDESFADVGYIALTRRRVEAPPLLEGSYAESWPGTVTLDPGNVSEWTMEMDADTPRFDVWVFERGSAGRAYHIYDIQHAEQLAAN